MKLSAAAAIVRTLESPNVTDSNFEPANVVDVLDRLAKATYALGNAVTPRKAVAGQDDTSGVESLTEAVMGISAGLTNIAQSISGLAEAVRSIER